MRSGGNLHRVVASAAFARAGRRLVPSSRAELLDLVDAYEYSTSIFDDVCQVADIFNEHQRQLLTRNYDGSKVAIDDYFQGVTDFQRRGERYLTSDNIHNHPLRSSA